MTIDSVHNWLLDNGYISVVNNKIVVSNKWVRDIGASGVVELKEKMKVKSDKEMFEKFVHVLKQNGCPTFANSGTSRYTVLSYTPSAKTEFIKLMSEGVDVERLREQTKREQPFSDKRAFDLVDTFLRRVATSAVEKVD